MGFKASACWIVGIRTAWVISVEFSSQKLKKKKFFLNFCPGQQSTAVLPTLGKQRQEDRNLAILHYITRMKPAWATWDPVSKGEEVWGHQRGSEERGRGGGRAWTLGL